MQFPIAASHLDQTRFRTAGMVRSALLIRRLWLAGEEFCVLANCGHNTLKTLCDADGMMLGAEHVTSHTSSQWRGLQLFNFRCRQPIHFSFGQLKRDSAWYPAGTYGVHLPDIHIAKAKI